MGTRFFIFLFFGISICSSAQDKKLDSLNKLLQKHTSLDSTYLNLLNEIAWYQCFHDANEGLKTSDKAIKLAQTLKNRKGLVTAYSRKAVNLNTLGKDSLALTYYNRVLSIHKQNGDSVSVARTAFNKGIVYYNRSDYLHSTANYQRALSIFTAEKDSLMMAKIFNSIGINQMTLANYPRALENYLNAARIYEKEKQIHTLDYASILSNIGLLQAHVGDLDEAQIYQNKALQLFKKLDYKEQQANALTNLGNIAKDREQVDEAVTHYEDALLLMREIGHKLGIANALCNLGSVYILKNEHAKAISYLDSTQPMYEQMNNMANLAELHQSLGQAYTQLYLKNKQNNTLATAEKHFENATLMAGNAGVLNIAQNAWEELAQTLSLRGKYKQAFEANEMAIALKDSLNMLSQREETARLEAEYAYAKKEDLLREKQEIQNAKWSLKINKQKAITYSFIMGLMLVLIIILIVLNYKKRKRETQINSERTAQALQLAKTQLKALQAQLNPHFMFNSMNAVAAFIMQKEPEEALDFLAKIAGLIRRTLQNSEKQFILLEEEVKFMHDYISLEIIRARGAITYAISIEESIDPEITLIPPGILQPFIENSIWHGPGKSLKEIHINVIINREGNHLVCVVEDNGVGRPVNGASKNTKHESMGFKIAKNRIALINRMHNIETSLNLIDKDHGLCVEMKLPYQEAF